MKCPVCNKDASVVDVRTRKNESKMRRRECVQCSLRFNTYELSEDRLAVLLDYERAFLKMQEIIEKYQ